MTRLSDLAEISSLAVSYRQLSAAMRQCELCYSTEWSCTANGHEIDVAAADMDKVFTAMRNKIEERLRVLGVTDFGVA